MLAYILRRLLLVIPTLFGIMVVNFALTQFVPGGPFDQIEARLEGEGDSIDAVAGNSAHHLDLYRIANADELEWLGLPDLLDESTLLLVEWPERATGALPLPDLRVRLQHAGNRRDLELEARTATAGKWLSELAQAAPGAMDGSSQSL